MSIDQAPPPSGLDLTLVAAVAENGVIGADGEMPWHYPRDLEHFRSTTMGSPVIMGRKTFENVREKMGGPLDGRSNVVMSSTLDEQPESNVVIARSLSAALDRAAELASDGVAYVIGGADVYEQTLPLASRMILTEIPERPAGDTTFPEWDPNEWIEVDSLSVGELTFVTYERRE